MNWWQALLTILLGNLIVLVPILLNSHPGTKYGIPFPVFARAAYGTLGANLPALMRALVACGWFGINAWIGGARAPDVLRLDLAGLDRPARARRFPDAATVPGHAVDLVRAVLGAQHPRSSTAAWSCCGASRDWAAPFVLVMTASSSAGRSRGRRPRADHGEPRLAPTRPAKFFAGVRPALTGDDRVLVDAVAEHARLHALRPPQREQAIGQVVALPTTMTVFAAMGIVITTATAIIYGKAIWRPGRRSAACSTTA